MGAEKKFESVNTEQVEALFDGVEMQRKGHLALRSLAWEFELERAARIRRTNNISYERKLPDQPAELVEEDSRTYWMEIVTPIDKKIWAVYTALWLTRPYDSSFAENHQNLGMVHYLEKPDNTQSLSPKEIFKKRDVEFINKLQSFSQRHVENLRPPVFSTQGFNELVESAGRQAILSTNSELL